MIWVANWVSEHIDQAGETSISQIVPRSCSRPAFAAHGWNELVFKLSINILLVKSICLSFQNGFALTC